MKKINLIVTGGIAASKAKKLYSLLLKKYLVNLVITNSAKRFVDFSDVKYSEEIFLKEKYEPHTHAEHIKVSEEAVLNIVYPATYNFIGKIANGMSDCMPSLIYAASNFPTILFPSMNERMYNNPILKENKKRLLFTNNVIWIEPLIGKLASGHMGLGRAHEPVEVLKIIDDYFIKFNELQNKKILLNFGRTRSYLDNVRFITNQSSGKMGLALKNILSNNSKELITFYGDTDFYLEENDKNIYCQTNAEMLNKMKKEYLDADIVIGCAALTDFYYENKENKKIEKSDKLNLEFVKDVDVLKSLGDIKTKQFLVGFALLDDFNLARAYKKLESKNMDMIILNTVNAIGNDKNNIKILFRNDKKVIEVDSSSKLEIALEIVKVINIFFK